MRTLLCGVLAGFVAPAVLHAQTPGPEPQPEIHGSKIVAPLLWKISSPAGGADSWLLGTIHLPRPEFSKFPPSVDEALSSADGVYTEIPMDPATIFGLSSSMVLPDGGTLEDKLTPETIEDLKTELAAIHPDLQIEPLIRFKPWALAASLVLLEDQMKYPGVLAMDTVVFQRGAMAGKETGGIETPGEQLAIFDELPEEDQIAILEDTLQQMRDAREEGVSPAQSLAEAYLSGNLPSLTVELEKWNGRSENPELTERLMERLLYKRNEIMAERIAEKLRAHPDTSFFFAIGAGHLDGDRGVIALLEKAGFKLERIEQ